VPCPVLAGKEILIMTTMYLATGDALAVLNRLNGSWQAALRLPGLPAQCLAADPLRPERVYCGTFGRGLWHSTDAGATWQPAGDGIPHAEVTAVAVSALERAGDHSVVWAGTEPSALFRSEDGGRSWQERPALRALPSAPTWSFPPRPWTSHVRWIAPDAHVATRLFVGIELGGVMRSADAGLTWEDRKPEGQHDAHTLATHPLAPDRVYEAAGGGYAETRDGGLNWRTDDAGLHHHYLWGLAVDPADPDTVVVSAARGPRQAHDHAGGSAEAFVYRRTAGSPWQQVAAGLPEPRGTGASVLATSPAQPGVVYAATRGGELYRSADAGLTWAALDVQWPQGYGVPNVHAFLVVDAA
jgi:photosystem II stability/assembly factor-like uncharacterized protein